MSFVRPLEERKYSKKDGNEENGAGLYVFISATPEGEDNFLDWMGGDPHNLEDFTEVMCRILKRAQGDVSLETVNNIRDALSLDPIDEINDASPFENLET